MRSDGRQNQMREKEKDAYRSVVAVVVVVGGFLVKLELILNGLDWTGANVPCLFLVLTSRRGWTTREVDDVEDGRGRAEGRSENARNGDHRPP